MKLTQFTLLLFKLTSEDGRCRVIQPVQAEQSDGIRQRNIHLKKGIFCLFGERNREVTGIIFTDILIVLPRSPERKYVDHNNSKHGCQKEKGHRAAKRIMDT
ncbi:hypothetical protein [Pantoea sp. QMID4]|uniref:hypothetical protein n=1 Tax=Pantoea sp. QMID4 TaxID=3016793 RepID=UPI00332AD30A